MFPEKEVCSHFFKILLRKGHWQGIFSGQLQQSQELQAEDLQQEENIQVLVFSTFSMLLKYIFHVAYLHPKTAKKYIKSFLYSFAIFMVVLQNNVQKLLRKGLTPFFLFIVIVFLWLSLSTDCLYQVGTRLTRRLEPLAGKNPSHHSSQWVFQKPRGCITVANYDSHDDRRIVSALKSPFYPYHFSTPLKLVPCFAQAAHLNLFHIP